MYTFPLEEDEQILKKDLASMHLGESPYTGALYLTTARIVFVGYFYSATNKFIEEAPLTHISEIVPEKSLLVFNNAFRVTTAGGRSFKVVVKGRDSWLKEIRGQMTRAGA